MTTSFRFLAGAGLAAIAIAGPAAARPTRDAEIRELKEQIRALTQRLDMQDQMRAEATAQANALQAKADAAVTDAAAAKTEVAAVKSAVPAEVKTALAANKPKKQWYDDTSISGRMYYNVSGIRQRSDGQTVGKSLAFDIKRFYLGIDHKFDDMFSANLTTDVSLIGNAFNVNGTPQSAAAQPGQTTTAPAAAFGKTVGETLYIKKAYLQAKFSPAFTVRLGASDLPWVPFVEDLYGYRYVEQTVIDRTGFGTSADWGVHASGALADGHVNYAVSVIDGAGYRNPLRSKTMDVEGRLSATWSGVTVGVGGYSGKRGANTDNPYSPTNNVATPVQTDVDVSTFHTARRLDAVAAYTTPLLRVGVEYFRAKNWNRVTQASGDTSDGWTGFASYKFADKASVFGKYERVRPTKDLFPDIREDYFNVGLSYSPAKIVDFALVYKRDRVENGFFAANSANPANFTFPVGGRDHGTYDEFGLYGQFRF